MSISIFLFNVRMPAQTFTDNRKCSQYGQIDDYRKQLLKLISSVLLKIGSQSIAALLQRFYPE